MCRRIIVSQFVEKIKSIQKIIFFMRYVFPPLTDYAEKIHLFGDGRPQVAPTGVRVDCLYGGNFVAL